MCSGGREEIGKGGAMSWRGKQAWEDFNGVYAVHSQRNALTTLPVGIGRMVLLKEITLKNNPLKSA